MDKKKVIFHINCLGKGGAEKVVSLLANEMNADGWQVIVAMCNYEEGEYYTAEAVKKIYMNYPNEKGGRFTKLFRRIYVLRKLISEEQPDVVVSFMKSSIYRSLLATFGMKIPLIISVRNDPQKDFVGIKNRIFTRYMSKKARGCVFQTEEAKSFFPKRLQQKSCVITNPVTPLYIGVKQSQKKRKVIANVGRLMPQKNHFLLINAFAKIASKYPDYEVQIFGAAYDTEYQQRLEDCIQSHGLKEQIRFMGTSNSLEKDLRNISLFVLSSDYEGLPNSLIEAMVMGIPVISTDCPCGGPRSLIEHGHNGLLVPVGDVDKLAESMDYLLTHSQKAYEMGNVASEIANQVEPHKVYLAWKQFILQKLNII